MAKLSRILQTNRKGTAFQFRHVGVRQPQYYYDTPSNANVVGGAATSDRSPKVTRPHFNARPSNRNFGCS